MIRGQQTGVDEPDGAGTYLRTVTEGERRGHHGRAETVDGNPPSTVMDPLSNQRPQRDRDGQLGLQTYVHTPYCAFITQLVHTACRAEVKRKTELGTCPSPGLAEPSECAPLGRMNLHDVFPSSLFLLYKSQVLRIFGSKAGTAWHLAPCRTWRIRGSAGQGFFFAAH